MEHEGLKALQKRVNYLEEKVNSQQQMLEMTSEYLLKIQRQLEQSKQEVLSVNKKVSDSINYAQRIQFALMADPSKIDTLFSNAFIFYRPKDVVSGDLYWLYNLPQVKYAAAIDCTGHGVPGAMLTVLANSLLNQIIGSSPMLSPKEILIQLDILIHHHFNSESEEVRIRDGLDISLLAYYPASSKLYLVCTHQPVHFYHQGEFKEIKGSRYSIGENSQRKINLEEHAFEVEKGDIIYLSSDGYMDQFSGAEFEKFKKKPFRELLQELRETMPLKKQKERLILEHEKWKGKAEQTDDILVMGIGF